MAKQFQNEDQFREWKNAFDIFKTPQGQIVFKDLMQFCYFLDSTFDPDPYERAKREGRRQVFLRIAQNINLTVDEAYRVYTGRYVERTSRE
jgi:hypothetical protein